MPNIVRVYRATVHSGKEEEFKSFLLDHGIPVLRKYKGFVSVTVGLPREDTPHDFMMTTVWKSVEALAEFSGENWSEAFVDPREAHLLAHTTVDHYYEATV